MDCLPILFFTQTAPDLNYTETLDSGPGVTTDKTSVV